jgi:hypothetical protein
MIAPVCGVDQRFQGNVVLLVIVLSVGRRGVRVRRQLASASVWGLE